MIIAYTEQDFIFKDRDPWPRAVIHLRKCDGFSEDEMDVLYKLQCGDAALFYTSGIFCGVWAVTEILKGTYSVWYAASDSKTKTISAEQWRLFMTHLEQHAVYNGCKTMQFYGRVGWFKVFRDFKPTTLYHKVLAHGEESRSGG